MEPLNLPRYEIKVKKASGRLAIFDILRRKYVALTPEEWVRQHFVHYLIEHLGYPSGLMANEKQLQIGDKHLRCDTLLYNRDLQPQMIIEYKAPSVALTHRVFDQILTYNLLLHVDYIVVSNGLQHICCKTDYELQKYLQLSTIPEYEKL